MHADSSLSPRQREKRTRRIAAAAVLVIACAAAGFASIIAGQDANWDLRNYRLYNPWAWLTGRYGYDIAPAQLQTFHNPLIDVPFYAMVAADWPPRVISFVLALPAGVAAFFLWKVAEATFAPLDGSSRRVAIVAALVVGLTGPNAVALLGLTMNEWIGTAFILAALWLLLRDADDSSIRRRSVLVSGLCVGLACGLKLTAAPYALGMAAGLMCAGPWRVSFAEACVFSIAALAGIAVTGGPWMLLLASEYGNPVFPYFDRLFASPLQPVASMHPRFGPDTALGWLTLPFELWRPRVGLVSESPYRDARFPLVAALGIIALGTSIVQRRSRPSIGASRECFLIVFFVVAFVAWAAVFAIHRYLLALEVVTGIAIALLLARIAAARAFTLILGTVVVAIVSTTRYPDWDRTRFGDHFIQVERPDVPANALILLTADAPMSFVLPWFPKDARFIGIEGNLVRSDQDSGLLRKASDIVARHDGPILQLTPQNEPAAPALSRLSLMRAGACGEVRSNLSRDVLALCPLVRVR
ncbi:MAG TPA: hypothetical protein VNE58_14900 [Casimicrobiaceae bacterium]|nr:hypothetical protein [Casimicrobiaceae bacterium]